MNRSLLYANVAFSHCLFIYILVDSVFKQEPYGAALNIMKGI